MKKTDFMTDEEKFKALMEPPKPKIEFVPKEVKTEPKQESKDTEDRELEDLYENYKFEWLAESGYTIYDLVEAIVNYAHNNKCTKELLEEPIKVVSDWENDCGFGEEIWLDYDSWCADEAFEEYTPSENTQGDSIQKEYDELSEILDYLEWGYSADELKKFGYSDSEIEKAIQYSNFGISTSKK